MRARTEHYTLTATRPEAMPISELSQYRETHVTIRDYEYGDWAQWEPLWSLKVAADAEHAQVVAELTYWRSHGRDKAHDWIEHNGWRVDQVTEPYGR